MSLLDRVGSPLTAWQLRGIRRALERLANLYESDLRSRGVMADSGELSVGYADEEADALREIEAEIKEAQERFV